MRQDKFTTRFQELLGQAQTRAADHSQQYIDPVHVLKAVLEDTEGTGKSLLERAGVRVGELRTLVDKEINKIPE
ncbi:Clp protease N-terminal domain-containing protein, partial [Turicimonas muris]|uniref:Clp protease N-terminal domain-containing protein n=1 Tax=Turicimonas muris TaxID=1796652 RepID=UPI00262BA1B0